MSDVNFNQHVGRQKVRMYNNLEAFSCCVYPSVLNVC